MAYGFGFEGDEQKMLQAETSRQITEAVLVLSTWINEQVENGATDALVAALREKGWTVSPPESVE